MGLFREVLYSNAPILKSHNEFFGDYANLNTINAPSNQEIQNFQMQKLKEFQKISFKNDTKTKKINHFLEMNGNLSISNNTYDQLIYDRVNDMFAQINQLISSGYMSSKVRSSLTENKALESNIVAKLMVLGNSLKSLRQMGNMTISSSYIDQLDNIISQLPEGDIDLVLRTLYHLKGDILEEVGVEWFNQRVPVDLNVKAISTGSIRGKGGQLIQDILIVDMDNIDLLDLEISYRLAGKQETVKLKDFLNKVENYSGSEQISIGLEAEELLQNISLLGIQAKSGINQLPWNTGSKNTWTSIQGSGQVDLYINFLDHMQNLRSSWDQADKNMKKISSAYTAMANYELAYSISKVLHLSQAANQYVLTPNGFMPFVSRILELYEKRGGGRYMFSFGGRIELEKNGDILTKSRPVVLGV